jgi:hypothetical protein
VSKGHRTFLIVHPNCFKPGERNFPVGNSYFRRGLNSFLSILGMHPVRNEERVDYNATNSSLYPAVTRRLHKAPFPSACRVPGAPLKDAAETGRLVKVHFGIGRTGSNLLISRAQNDDKTISHCQMQQTAMTLPVSNLNFHAYSLSNYTLIIILIVLSLSPPRTELSTREWRPQRQPLTSPAK